MLVKIAKIVHKMKKAWMYASCAAFNEHDKKDLCSGCYSKCKSCPYSKINEKNQAHRTDAC